MGTCYSGAVEKTREELTMEELLKWIIISIVLLAPGYAMFRVFFLAMFKSWFDAKKQSTENDNNVSKTKKEV